MDPDYEEHVEAVAGLARAEDAFSRGDYPACRENAGAVIGADPSLGRAWELLGILDLADGDPISALGHLEMTVSCNGNFEESEYILEVLQSQQELLEIDEESTLSLMDSIGSHLLQNRSYASAMCLYDGISKKVHDWRVLSTLGFLRREMGMLDGALEMYESALEMEGAPVEVLSDLAIVLIKMGRLKDASGALEECIDAGLQRPHVMNNLGFVREALGDIEGALEAYEETINMDPAYYPALYSKGRILQKMGRDSESRSIMDRALELEGRVYRLEDVTGREERELTGALHAKELMTPMEDDD